MIASPLRYPGGKAKLIAQFGELTFELDRGLLEKMDTEFSQPKIEPAGPAFPTPAAPLSPFPPGEIK